MKKNDNPYFGFVAATSIFEIVSVLPFTSPVTLTGSPGMPQQSSEPLIRNLVDFPTLTDEDQFRAILG